MGSHDSSNDWIKKGNENVESFMDVLVIFWQYEYDTEKYIAGGRLCS